MKRHGIITRDNPNLFRQARKISSVDESVRRLMDEMVTIMDAAPGVGLAATQIDVPLRVVVMRIDGHVYQLANPELVKRSGEQLNDEGCLSVPGWVGETKRAAVVHFRGIDRGGKVVKVRAEGQLAQCIQHEVDHLNGVLFLDRLTSLDSLRPLRPKESEDDEIE